MTFKRERDAEPLKGYRLIEPLGSGGFGEVWKCEAPGGLFKGIKFVYGNLNALDAEGIRAEQELNALNRIKEVRHPFVLSMDRIEVVDGELVIVMELADRSLYDSFVECQAAGLVGIPRDALLRYIRDAAEALDHMNEKHNLQHLDIKPRNLFLVSDRVKVADFGLVKHVERQTGMIGGVTPLYAAPETFEGRISAHSDQYSLAIVYQELLTGQRPFNGKNPRQLALQHTQQPPELRALPEAERAVVARALSKAPDQRFPNCLAFVRALYTARTVPAPGSIVVEPAPAAAGNRPKTMAETMEDFGLEQGPAESANGISPVPGKAAPSLEEMSQLGITTHLPDTGVLRPTLVIGVGGFGRRALLDLRCRFLDRFGGHARLPMQRFLYIDSDPEAVRAAVRGSPEVAYSAQEVYHLPLQPVGNYRRRMLDQLSEWLPREKLYALPRSLQTQGSRALGRLAFADNHLRLLTRLRRELEHITHADALYQSVTQTGLALRDGRPRIYVIAAAGGGSSGLLVDLGYALRQVLHRLNMGDGDVTALLFCGATDDPATPRPEQANVYATLTELNHFTDPAIPFAAQYGVDGPRTVDNGQPFQRVYLLKWRHRNPEAVPEAVAHLGSYLFHELTTPLGLRLERTRHEPVGDDATIFRSFGTYGVWFPRGLLLRQAAQQACIRLLQDWQGTGDPTAQAEVEAACARALADPELRFEALCARIEESASSASGGHLGGTLTALLSKLEEQSQQSVAQDDPGNWAQQALAHVQEWVGSRCSRPQDSDWRKSKLSRTLLNETQKLAEDWEKRLAEVAFGLMEHPGRRVAAAEAGLTRFLQFCDEAKATHQARLEQQVARTKQAALQLENALTSCVSSTGGFSLFGGRARRALRVFMDHLAAFSRQRLIEELAAAGLLFFETLRGRLEERMRELAFCRQRLRHLQECLEGAPTEQAEDVAARPGMDVTAMHLPLPSTEDYWEAMRASETVRLVLPEGEGELRRAADGFIARLGPEQWMQLDQALQDRVLAPGGGLHRLCLTSGDLARALAGHFLPQAAACLGDLLPITDVAQVEFSAAAKMHTDVAAQAASYHAGAAPLVAAKDSARQHSFLLVPASDAGKTFGEDAKRALTGVELLRVPGQADLMFCREQGNLAVEDLQRELRPCRRAYEDAAAVPNTSPHARFDIVDWVPLDP
ncbi:MAG TPA: tubulin-like doman-containing protein [Gemmataceae bacterium]|jgi:hypothetical protein|nr:tubulin-like doman-containing protein [Gemmataceae bacterium]